MDEKTFNCKGICKFILSQLFLAIIIINVREKMDLENKLYKPVIQKFERVKISVGDPHWG